MGHALWFELGRAVFGMSYSSQLNVMGCMTVGRTVYRRYTDVIDFNISKIFLSNDKLLMKTIFSNPMCISLHSTLFYCASKRKAASLSLTDLLVLVISRCCFDFKVDW